MSTTNLDDSKTSARRLAFDLTEEEILSIVTRQPDCDSERLSFTGCPYPTNEPLLFIKYGNNKCQGRDSEARSHQFAYESLQKVPAAERQGIHIPEIYRVIDQPKYTYILMEYIPGNTLQTLWEDREAFKNVSQKYYDKIERALKLFLTFPVPDDALPGPVGGGIIRHPLFKDGAAAIQYDSIAMLQKHINKIATWLLSTAPTVQLETDLYFVYSDLSDRNFIFTETGDLYIIDFESASFLPISFMSFMMHQNRLVSSALKERMDLPSQNIPAMHRACGLFGMSVPTLGLPVDARHTPRDIVRQREQEVLDNT